MSVSSFVTSVCSSVKHAGLLMVLAGSTAGVAASEAKGDVDFSFSLSFGNAFSWCEPVYVCPPPVVVTPIYCPPPVVVHRPWSYCPPTYYYRPVVSHWNYGWNDCDDRWGYRPFTSVTTTTFYSGYSSYTHSYSSYGHSWGRPVHYGSGLSLNFFFGDDDDDCDRDWRYRHHRDRYDHDDYRDHRGRDRDRDYGRGRDNQPIFQSSNNVTVNNYGPVGPQTIQQVGPVGPNAGGVFPASNAGTDSSNGLVTGLDGREGPRSQAKPLRISNTQQPSGRNRDRDRASSQPAFAAEPIRVESERPVIRKPVESVGKQPPMPRPSSKPLRVDSPAFAEAPQQQPSAAIPVSQPVVKPANTRPTADVWAGPRGPEKPVVSNPAAKPSRQRENVRKPAASRPAFDAGEVRVEQPRMPEAKPMQMPSAPKPQRTVSQQPAIAPQGFKPADAAPRPSSKPMRSAPSVQQPVFEQPAQAPARPSLKPGERPSRISDMQRPASKPRRPAKDEK
jgi:hypothetical protein